MVQGSDGSVGPFENGFYRRQFRQALILIVAVPVLILALVGLVTLNSFSGKTPGSLEVGAILAVIVFEALIITVLPRYTFQARQLWADAKGLRLRWKYLAGGREMEVPWDRLRGKAEENDDHTTLVLYWGSSQPTPSTVQAFEMDPKSFSLLKPLLQSHGGGVRLQT